MATVPLPWQSSSALRYILVGGTNFVLNWSLLWCFTAVLHWPYLVSMVAAFLLTALYGHRRNRFFTFRATEQSYFPQLQRYTVTMVASLGFSMLLMWVLVERVRLHYLLANLCVAAIVALLSFWINSRWVFGTERDSSPPGAVARKSRNSER
jgi:putative flippase GtrA